MRVFRGLLGEEAERDSDWLEGKALQRETYTEAKTQQ